MIGGYALDQFPLPIRALICAVVVLVFIAGGGLIATLPYEAGQEDPLMVMIFNGVFGTIGFALVTYLTPSRRILQLTITTGLVWAISGFAVILYMLHPVLWLLVLVALTTMALLGAGLARLVEQFARE